MTDKTFVYVISEVGGPFLKVGIARNPDARMANLQTANARKLILQKAFDYPTRAIATVVEQKIHELLAPHHVSGEWFSCHVDDAMAVWWQVSDWADEKFEIEREKPTPSEEAAYAAMEAALEKLKAVTCPIH